MHQQNSQSESFLRKQQEVKGTDRLSGSRSGVRTATILGFGQAVDVGIYRATRAARGDDMACSALLVAWNLDLSGCRLQLNDAEVEAIVLGPPNGKCPGPHGIPACGLKVFARQLVPILLEAWDELLLEKSSDHLGI